MPVALVTGATRGIGRGVAAALGEQHWTVYVTGRSSGGGDRTIEAAARLVDEMGGSGVAVRADHADDDAVAGVLRQVSAEEGRLDLLVNNVFKIQDPPAFTGGLWGHPTAFLEPQIRTGLRAPHATAWHPAPLLFAAAPPAPLRHGA